MMIDLFGKKKIAALNDLLSQKERQIESLQSDVLQLERELHQLRRQFLPKAAPAVVTMSHETLKPVSAAPRREQHLTASGHSNSCEYQSTSSECAINVALGYALASAASESSGCDQ